MKFELLWVRNGKNCHFSVEPAHLYRYRKWVPVPIGQRQSGTGTDQSGTGTDASNSPDFCTLHC